MNSLTRYVFIGLGIILLGYILWYFQSIVAYVIISKLLLILGKQGLLIPMVAGLFPTVAFLVYGWYTVVRNHN